MCVYSLFGGTRWNDSSSAAGAELHYANSAGPMQFPFCTFRVFRQFRFLFAAPFSNQSKGAFSKKTRTDVLVKSNTANEAAQKDGPVQFPSCSPLGSPTNTALGALGAGLRHGAGRGYGTFGADCVRGFEDLAARLPKTPGLAFFHIPRLGRGGGSVENLGVSGGFRGNANPGY